MIKSEVEKNIDKFFDKSEPNTGDTFSSLNLLWRQKEICLHEDKEGRVAVWPGVMVIFAGIDMLGFYHCDGELLGSNNRFKTFYTNFFSHPQIHEESELIYQARNAMMHTFGLYTKDRHDREFKFIYDWQKELDFIINYDSDFNMHIINFYGLNKAFDKAVENYNSFLLQEIEIHPDGTNIRNFTKAYRLFGLISAPITLSKGFDDFSSSNASRIVLPDE